MARVTPYSLPVGQLIGRALAIYLRNLLPFTLLGVIFLAPWIALHLYLDKVVPVELPAPRRYGGPETDPTVTLLQLAGTILQSLLTFLLTGAVTYGVVQQLRGQPAGLAQVVSKGLGAFSRVLATAFLCGLRVLLFTLLLVIPGIVQQVKLYVAIPAAVIEGVGGHAAMERSRRLTQGSGWQIFGAWLLLYLLGMGLAIVAVFVSHGLDEERAKLPVWVDLVIALFVSPFGSTVMATAYFLLRQGKENVDPRAIAAVFD